MNIRTVYTSAALGLIAGLGLSLAANLQPQDVFFFSTHKNPTDIVGDSKNAFILTEGGILMYDYRRSTWMDNLAPDAPIQAMRYSDTRSKLYLLVQGGRYLEYNPTFRRFTDASATDFNAANAEGGGADLNGLTLEGDNFFMGDAIRDKYMRRVPINKAKVFEYDNLWVLTQGLGLFYGSLRRKQATSFWFGLDDPSAQVIYPEGNNLWFGSCHYDGVTYGNPVVGNTNGSLVRSKSDLNGWKVYPAQLEYGFGDGCIHDIVSWKNYIWLATEKGVVRHDPATGQFRTLNHIQGGTDIRVYCLHVHENALYAGTEQGVSTLADPGQEFRSLETPIQGGVAVYELESKDKDLWAGTRYGLYVYRPDSWKSLKEVSGKDVPESFAVPVPSVVYHDTTLYWISNGKIMVKPRKVAARVLLERDRPFRLRFDGDMLYVAFYSGVTAYDTRRGLWTDFNLEDGIRGTQVKTMTVTGGKLWIGTDVGITRINLKSYLP